MKMSLKSLLIILLGGLLFGFGLALSTMAQPEVVLSFLQLDDFGLALVMGAALVIAIPVYQLAPRVMKRPWAGQQFARVSRRITITTIIGGVIFGIGWGISGVCPGAGVASLGIGNWPIGYALIGMLIGAYAQGCVGSLFVNSKVK